MIFNQNTIKRFKPKLAICLYHSTADFFEIPILINKINDKINDINALVKYCKSSPCKVNLIEYNMTENPYYVAADDKIIDKYIFELEKNRISVTIRKSRGKDIDAACGQLANKLIK